MSSDVTGSSDVTHYVSEAAVTPPVAVVIRTVRLSLLMLVQLYEDGILCRGCDVVFCCCLGLVV